MASRAVLASMSRALLGGRSGSGEADAMVVADADVAPDDEVVAEVEFEVEDDDEEEEEEEGWCLLGVWRPRVEDERVSAPRPLSRRFFWCWACWWATRDLNWALIPASFTSRYDLKYCFRDSIT